MFICRATVSPQAFPTIPHFFFFFDVACLPSIPLSATFPYPPMLYSISASVPFSPPSLSLSPFPITPPFLHLTHSLFPLSAFLCSGPIGSHYIDGPDDSVEWCTLFPSASPRPFSAACSCSRAALIGDSRLCDSPATSRYYSTGHGEICMLMHALFRRGLSRCKCRRCEKVEQTPNTAARNSQVLVVGECMCADKHVWEAAWEYLIRRMWISV